MIELILLLIWGLCVGLMVGFTAVGKGLLGVPGLIVIFQMPPIVAVGSMAVAGFVMMLSGSVQHYRCGNVVPRIAVLFSVTAVPASYLGARFADTLNAFLPLQFVIGVVILASVAVLFYRYVIARAEPRKLRVARWQLVLSPVLGVALGALMGATSISGSVIVIVFIMALKLPSPKAVGTTSFVSAISLLLASVAHVQEGNVDWAVVACLTPGAIAGAALSARYAERAPRQVLRVVILAVLLAAGVMLLLDA
ncbi:MAG: sulfite exporter TauE/SafE family protein [Planctomycetota bacterium]